MSETKKLKMKSIVKIFNKCFEYDKQKPWQTKTELKYGTG
jgi:hypothetical protein